MTQSLPRRVALAFEGGEDPEPAAAMLDALAVGGITSTFFIDGLWAEECPDIVRRIASEGHELGNHGHGHPDWTALSDEDVRADLARVDGIVHSLCGAATRPWVLPPKSAIDDRVEAVLVGDGYRSVNPYPLDGRGWEDQSASAIHQRAMQQLADGASLLTIHTGRWESADALGRILSDLDRLDIEATTISALGEEPRYPPPDARSGPSASHTSTAG